MVSQLIINKLQLKLINTILKDGLIRQDYEDHCFLEDLIVDDFLNNADIKNAHIYAIAKSLLFHIEMHEQKITEGDI